MPYLVTHLKPREVTIPLISLLTGKCNPNMVRPHSNAELTGTKTFFYKNISEKKLASLNIEEAIEFLESFYNMYKHLDIHGNHQYNYELQMKYKSKFKHECGNNDILLQEKITDELEKKGKKYNSFYSSWWTPKRSSKPGQTKWRRIDKPCDQLYECLSTLKDIFTGFMDGCTYHTAAFAYIPKRCTKDVAMKHANSECNWVLKLDFSNFFGSINLEFMMDSLSNIFPFSEIVKSDRGYRALENCLHLCLLDGGLPQGTPISPLLSNIVMIPFDYKLSNGIKNYTVTTDKGHKYHLLYTRYADDIQISCRAKFNFKEIEDYVIKVSNILKMPMKLNTEKTKVESGSTWILGLMVNENHKVTIGYKKKKQLEAALNNYALDRKSGEKWDVSDLYNLQGLISHYKSIEKENIIRLINEYSRKHNLDIMSAIKQDIKCQV